MYLLGLTGGIASGKTTACGFFEEAGVPVLYADREAHLLQRGGTPEYRRLITLFGRDILDEQDMVDRRKLFARLLADPRLFGEVELFMHSGVKRVFWEKLTKLAEQDTPLVVMEMPLVFTSPVNFPCDSIAACVCHDETRRRRGFQRPRMTLQKWEMLNHRQCTLKQFMEKADHLIHTDNGLEQTEAEVHALLKKLKNKPATAWPQKWHDDHEESV